MSLAGGGSATLASTTALGGAGEVNLAGQQREFNIDGMSTLFVGARLANGGLSKSGAGTMELSGFNSYAGVTQILTGTLRATAAGAIPVESLVEVAPDGSFIAATNGMLEVGGLSNVAGESLGGTVSIAASSTLVLLAHE